MMSEASLVGITGRELCAVRERAGWSRPRLAHLMRTEFEGDPHTVASIQRYEGLDEVPPVFAQRVRDAIGADIFDRLLELQRSGDAPRRRGSRGRETPGVERRPEGAGGATTTRAAIRNARPCAAVKGADVKGADVKGAAEARGSVGKGRTAAGSSTTKKARRGQGKP